MLTAIMSLRQFLLGGGSGDPEARLQLAPVIPGTHQRLELLGGAVLGPGQVSRSSRQRASFSEIPRSFFPVVAAAVESFSPPRPWRAARRLRPRPGGGGVGDLPPLPILETPVTRGQWSSAPPSMASRALSTFLASRSVGGRFGAVRGCELLELLLLLAQLDLPLLQVLATETLLGSSSTSRPLGERSCLFASRSSSSRSLKSSCAAPASQILVVVLGPRDLLVALYISWPPINPSVQA